jgi:hypothetical protein
MVMKTDISKVSSRLVNRMLHSSARADARRFINSLYVEEFKQDNFTIITLANQVRVLAIGVSKRMPNDPIDDGIGYNLALVRAVRSAIQKHIIDV